MGRALGRSEGASPTPSEVAQIAHGRRRHETPAQQAAFQQLRQPFTIPPIGLAARERTHAGTPMAPVGSVC
jgi:hypothetical protein